MKFTSLNYKHVVLNSLVGTVDLIDELMSTDGKHLKTFLSLVINIFSASMHHYEVNVDYTL